MPERRVLFLAYNFPPHGGAGVQRALKFVKYLPQFGWQPVVVAAHAAAAPVQDASLLAEIPAATPVYRVPAFSILNLIQTARRYRLDRLAVLLNLLLQIPDPTIFWARRAAAQIESLIQEHQPAVIFSTSGPYSAHLLGQRLKRRYNLPWAADFRDPWSQNRIIPYLPGYRALNRRLERRVLAAADRVIAVSQPWLADLRANLGAESAAGKFIVIPNGYDEADFPTPTPYTPQPPFTLTHLGSFYRTRRPAAFLAGLRLALARGDLSAGDVRVLFVGKNSALACAPDLPVECLDYVPHQQLADIRRQSDAFLLLLDPAPANRGNHSGKLFEYLAAERPILAVAPPGGVAQALIAEAQAGVCVDDTPEAIAAALAQLYAGWRSGRAWQPRRAVIQRYTRRSQAQRLAALFAELAAEG